jgi:copper chaperone CopZ
MSRAEKKKSRRRSRATEERAEGGQMAELSFKVPEMTDGNSAQAITREVRKLDGIAEVQIDPHTGWVVITGQRIDSPAIRQAIGNAGYDAHL